MPLELTVVDAFTEEPFRGNPAAVAIVDAFPSTELMQAVAREMNLSETAFVVPRADGDHDLRWFTPAVEVDLCGHATLAAAHVLDTTTAFHTRGGVLTCAKAAGGWIEMDFPADPPVAAVPPVALGLPHVCWYGVGRWDAIVEVDDPSIVRTLRPDLAAIADVGTRCVIVTARADTSDADFISRVFAPNVGIAEDPVTGSAHCTLAVHWAGRLGRDELVGEQVSARGGTVRVRWNGDRVAISGQAVTVATTSVVAWPRRHVER